MAPVRSRNLACLHCREKLDTLIHVAHDLDECLLERSTWSCAVSIGSEDERHAAEELEGQVMGINGRTCREGNILQMDELVTRAAQHHDEDVNLDTVPA